MNLNTFKLEDYLCEYEFNAPYLLCCSDAESWSLEEILKMANVQEHNLWDKLRLGYTESKGLPVLRETIASTLYPGLTADNIRCFAGAEDAIFCTFFALCNPKDHVIVLTPCYQSLLEIPKLKGSSITTIDLKEENDWRIDLEAIKKAIEPNTKCLVMNFPHNPTGQIISQDELNALVALLDQHGIILFSDEVYRLLGPNETKWADPAASIYPKAISLGVMSKAYGMAGLRIGWIACQDKTLLEQIEKIKHYTSICNCGPAEIISLIALRNQTILINRNNNIVDNNLSLLDGFFKEQGTRFSWVRPQGGCVGFVKYHGAEPIDLFCKRLVDKSGILLLPASIYDVNSNHFRIGFGRKNMPEALERFKNFLASNSVDAK